jgi:phage tail sheath protein FI
MAQRTITSPGVEIRETDLSLIAPQNIGTNFYITGFAQQGPLDEVLKITTKQELDRVFGTPTNSAERYFYYSISEMLNSPGNVYASRLPYGENAGDGFGAKYSALVYPVRTVANANGAGLLSAYDVTLNFSTSQGMSALKDASFSFKTGNGALSSVGFTIGGVAGGYSTTPDVSVAVTYNQTPAAIATSIKTAINTASTAAGGTASGMGTATSSTNTVTVVLTGQSDLGSGSTATSPSIIAPFSNKVSNSFTINPQSNQVVTTDLDVLSGTYVLGEPTHLELTQDDYFNALEGSAFDWSATAGEKDEITKVSDLSGAGLVVLNKAQTTINSQFEGYYVGIADNTNINPDSNFDSILEVKTVNAAADSTTEYTTIPNGVLQFGLSATPRGTSNTVSEVMENLTDYNIDGREDDDVLNIGIFKLRKSIYANEAFKLDYVVEEGIVGSANYQRQQLNPTGGPNNPFFLETRDSRSRNVELLVNPYISNYFRGTDALLDGKPIKKLRVNTTQLESVDSTASGIDAVKFTELNAQLGKAENLYAAGSFVDNKIKDKNLGNVPAKLDRALEAIQNDEIYDIDVVVEGGLGTVYAAASAAGTTYYDEYNSNAALKTAVDGLRTSNDITGVGRDLRNNYSTIFNKFEQFCSPPYLGGGRGDCIFIADVLRQILITGEKTRVLDNKARNFQTDVYWPIRHQFENENTSYAAVYAQWPLIYDNYSGRQVFVPFSGFAGAAMARTDAANFPWFAPAGFTRGLIQFANDLAVNPNQKQRDELYKANINPVANFPNQGQVIFGQKTLSKKPSAFDRINVRRLFLALERPTKKVSRFFVFEQNTEFTRQRLINTLTPLFERAKNNEGIYDYLIVCDERNNTAEVIDANELVVDIYIKPVRTAEFILVNFYATRTDANFEEIIG